ncbi:MAG: hypothetical protein HRT42_14160 [Campylobacteraceae bacterium]|nr:hypothetical protein [Campylobacteraceae bacterium]
MKKITKILMNDQIDRHNEQMTLSFLESARNQTNANIISSHKEHDFRFPPIARVNNAYIKNEHGINSLYGEFDFFELNDVNKQNNISNKQLKLHDFQDSSISYDRSYELNGLVEDVKNLQKIISDEEPLFEVKKSFEPVSTLIVIVGTIAAKSFIEGFFNKAGSDFWDGLKNIIAKNSAKDETEKIYIFNTMMVRNNYKVEVIINFTNPTTYDIQNVLYEHQEAIDSVINKYEEDSIDVARIIFNSNQDSLHHEYSVFQDGTPFDIRDLDAYEKILDEVLNKV